MSDNEFKMSTGQAHELAMAFGRNGWTLTDVKKLSEGDTLQHFLSVIQGKTEILFKQKSMYDNPKCIINCDADPILVADGYEVVEHRKHGRLEWNPPGRVGLYLSNKQKGQEGIGGDELRKELVDKPVLNANVLDCLLANPYLIPDYWKDEHVVFWGTIYRNRTDLFVRCLYWGLSGYSWVYCILDEPWYRDLPAAMLTY